MRLLILAPDETSISPQQAVELAKTIHGSHATVVPIPSSNNDYANLYFSAQILIAERIANISFDSKDESEYNIRKQNILNEAITRFREVLEEVASDTEEKINNEC